MGRIQQVILGLINARSLQLECARVLHESLVVLVLTYGSEKMLWKEKERSRIRAVQMDNFRGLLGIRRMDEVPNARIRQLCRVRKVFSCGSDMWREGRMAALLRGCR